MEEKTEGVSHEGEGPSPRRAKKPYERPVLTEYGSVAKLTRATLGSMSDGLIVGMRVCL